jgi:type II secretory pathway pseudopilin PulG
MRSHTHETKGFSILEALLSVAIIVIIAAIMVPIYYSTQSRNDLEVAANAVVQSLRRAQALSEASQNDGTWGVSVATGSITLFKGTTYAARDTAYDEISDMAGNITYSGAGETVFTKMYGLPLSTGTLTLSIPVGETKIITINSKGMVDF